VVYFFINLLLHGAVSLTLLLFFFRALRVNYERKNKRGISYLLPVLLTAILLAQVIGFTVPRLLDSVYVMKNNYRTVSGEVESIGVFNNTMRIDGKDYFYNPLSSTNKPLEGDYLEISYTRYSRFVNDMKRVPEE
jgi:hypothetical protein